MKLIVVILLVTISAEIVCGEEQTNRKVMTWVPPYAIDASLKTLNNNFDGARPQASLTHLGLQFWTPTKAGGVVRTTKYSDISDPQIAAFKDWGKQHNIRILLCVYNEAASWNLTRSAFETHRKKFIESLVKETLRLKLDGIDVDLEGTGAQESSQAAFVLFIKELASRLHQHDKVLTVDSFAYKWNAPNRNWWSRLLPHVDGLNVMGYHETGANAADWRSYASIKEAAGTHLSKVLIGMPSHKSAWQGSSAIEHLNWVVDNPDLGLAIWDAQLRNQTWRTKEVWEAISKIRGRK